MDYIEQNLYNFLNESKRKYDYTIIEQKNITNILMNLCNPNNQSFLNLTEKEIIILRGYLDVYSLSSFEQTVPNLTISMAKLHALNITLYYIRLKLNSIIKHGYDFSFYNKMHSPIPKEYEDYYISFLKLCPDITQLLLNNNIYSLKDLLSLSKNDLLKKQNIGKYIIKCIELALKQNNLKFLDELSFEDIKQIILSSEEETILNSSVYWIKNLTKKDIRWFESDSLCTIKNLVEYLKEGHKIADSTVEYFKLIGFDLEKGKKINPNLNVKICDLNLDENIKNIILTGNIYKIEELLLLDKEGLYNLFNNNMFLIIGIINLVHNMGLQFSYEINQTVKKIK